MRPKARATAVSTGMGSKVASALWRLSWRSARSAGSSVACGPAASSASVTAEIASSSGSVSRSIRSRSMSTEVSIRPRGGCCSGTRTRVLVEHCVDVAAEPVVVDARSAAEGGGRRVPAHELLRPQRHELADGGAVASHDEGLTAVQRPHYLAAFVAQLALGDPPSHGLTVARVLRAAGPVLSAPSQLRVHH